MLVLSRFDVERALDLDQLLDAVAGAMADLSAGHASVPTRVAATVAGRDAMLAAMPAFLPSAPALATKLVSLFPHNRDRPTHQGVICCFDPETGTPIALMDGTYVTAARTAAGSALATRLLARRDARVGCVIGTGVQARAHARALSRAWPLDMLRITGRDRAKVEDLVAELSDQLDVTIEAAPSIEDGVRFADIICATTHAPQPVVCRQWLRSGTHINSVGYNTSGDGEIDAATIRDALLVVESRAAVLAVPPAGAVEVHRAIEDGTVTAEHIHAEVGELVSGTTTGRTSDEQLTLYKSVGVAVQDAAAAALALQAATNHGVGTTVTI
jgi:ornithine cyclodeaminase